MAKQHTRLAKAIRPLAKANEKLSGVVAIPHGSDAFAARVMLADAAEHTLDAQYYMWHNDMSGTLMFDALRRAARRGVKVRLLLDDNNTGGLDTILAALDADPNIEVRLFNPFRLRRCRPLCYITDFSRLNRRMHNKSFTADGQATIVGGRNVGDEYFEAGDNPLFVDLDVLAVGRVVGEVCADFDRYWTCESVKPASKVLTKANKRQAADVEADARKVANDPQAKAYVQALSDSSFVRDMLARKLDFEWTDVAMVSDDPIKGTGHAGEKELLMTRLQRVLQAPKRELLLVSAYFVPTRSGTDAFVKLADNGVKITVLTNALEATDVPPVHAGYAKWRKPLLGAGIALLELKRSSGVRDRHKHEHGHRRRRGRGLRGIAGSSGSSLHAKTFTVDGARVFVGSFNFDPRSARLNTELGFVIDSTALAAASAQRLAKAAPTHSYRVSLERDGALKWSTTTDDGRHEEHDTEPGTSWWMRLAVRAMSRLPIDWML